MPVPLPRIGTATANLARTMAAPAVAPISSAISAVRNPMAAMDLPPVMAAAGGFARDASQMGQLSLPFGDRGMSGKKTGQQLDDIETNTDKTSDMLSDGIPTMVALLARIESNTRGPSEEELMESRKKKGGPKAKKKGKGDAAGEDDDDLGAFDIAKILGTAYLGQRIAGMIGTVKKFIGSIFGKGGLISRIATALSPKNLFKQIGTKAIKSAALKGIGMIAKKFMSFVVLPFTFIAGYLEEITDPESEGSIFRKHLKGVLVGLTEALDVFLFGLLPEQAISDMLTGVVDSVAEWWGEQDFKELWREWIPTMGDLASGLGTATEWMGELLMDLIRVIKDAAVSYFTEGGGIGFMRAGEAIGDTADYVSGAASAAGSYISDTASSFGSTISNFFSRPEVTRGLQAVAGAPMGLGAVPPMVVIPTGGAGQGVNMVDASNTTVTNNQVAGAKPPVTPPPSAFAGE